MIPQLIVTSRACIRAVSWVLAEHPSSSVLDRGSNLRTGATVSSRMAQSRCGSAGELLAWRPIVRDTKASVGVFRGNVPGL